MGPLVKGPWYLHISHTFIAHATTAPNCLVREQGRKSTKTFSLFPVVRENIDFIRKIIFNFALVFFFFYEYFSPSWLLHAHGIIARQISHELYINYKRVHVYSPGDWRYMSCIHNIQVYYIYIYGDTIYYTCQYIHCCCHCRFHATIITDIKVFVIEKYISTFRAFYSIRFNDRTGFLLQRSNFKQTGSVDNQSIKMKNSQTNLLVHQCVLSKNLRVTRNH